jgi:heat-inducible transcriptional repressor
LGTESLRGVHLVHLGANTLLAVSVAESGRVSQEIVRLSFDPSDAELDEAEILLARAYAGKSLEDGEAVVKTLTDGEASDRLLRILRTVASRLRRSEESTSDVYVGGQGHLAALWEDLANVSLVLGLLSQEAAVRDLLSDPGDGTAVRIGSELDLEDVDLAVVSTAYVAGEHGLGRVGVIGPMRMDYRRTIRIVEEVGDGLADSLGS